MSMEIKNRPYSAETGTRRTGAAAAEKSKDRTGASGARAMDVDEYMSALSKKYSYFGRTTKIANVPTTVNVSPAYLRKCANDPEKREELEKRLDSIGACVPIGAQRTRTLPRHWRTAERNGFTERRGLRSRRRPSGGSGKRFRCCEAISPEGISIAA